MAAVNAETENKLQAERNKRNVLLFTNQNNNTSFQTFPKIRLSKNDNKGLFVSIETKNLSIRSVQRKDLNNCISLYGDYVVMSKFGTGQILDTKSVTDRMTDWLERWNNGNCFSPLSVFKKDSDEFVGQFLLTAGENNGAVELAALFLKPYWGQSIATEVTSAIVLHYVPLLVEQGYKVGDKPFESIIATARKDNPASNAILKKLGLTYLGDIEKFGAIRGFYRKDLRTTRLRSKL